MASLLSDQTFQVMTGMMNRSSYSISASKAFYLLLIWNTCHLIVQQCSIFHIVHLKREQWSIGATTVQIFTANQSQWNARPLTEEIRDRFHKALDETGLKNIMSHAFRKEIDRCQFLRLSYLNFHPGAALKEGTDPVSIELVSHAIPICVCIDTFHIFAEEYDIY
ncbi:hypothetical protein ACTFIR_005768 [Dictyostelium discoideum]